MLATCIMPTAGRRRFVPLAIERFLAQDYAARELLILDDGDDPVGDLVSDDPRIRYVRSEPGLTLGDKRNRACELARGEIVVHWDDDDWYPPNRVSRQVAALVARRAEVCGSSRVYYRDAEHRRAWEFSYVQPGRPWVGGNTLAYRKTAWERTRFQSLSEGEDCHFVWSHDTSQVADLADPGLCIASIHLANTSLKRPAPPLWKRVHPSVLERVIDEADRRAAGAPVPPRAVVNTPAPPPRRHPGPAHARRVW